MALNSGLGLRRPSAIPGFGLALGFTLTYLGLIVLIPLGALVLKGASLGVSGFWHVVTEPRTLAALRLSFVTALIAASVNAVLGVVIAWVLVRYQFPGRRLLDAIVDLPFALPTAVAGIALTALYAPNGWIGSWLDPLGIKVAYTPLGIVIALIFIGLPFVVRTVQPVLEEFDKELRDWRLPAETLEQMRSVNDHFGFTFRDFDFGQFWSDLDGHVFNPETGMPKLTAARSLCAKADGGWITVNRIENGKVVAA